MVDFVIFLSVHDVISLSISASQEEEDCSSPFSPASFLFSCCCFFLLVGRSSSNKEKGDGRAPSTSIHRSSSSDTVRDPVSAPQYYTYSNQCSSGRITQSQQLYRMRICDLIYPCIMIKNSMNSWATVVMIRGGHLVLICKQKQMISFVSWKQR